MEERKGEGAGAEREDMYVGGGSEEGKRGKRRGPRQVGGTGGKRRRVHRDRQVENECGQIKGRRQGERSDI